jgi:hypothetical protein
LPYLLVDRLDKEQIFDLQFKYEASFGSTTNDPTVQPTRVLVYNFESQEDVVPFIYKFHNAMESWKDFFQGYNMDVTVEVIKALNKVFLRTPYDEILSRQNHFWLEVFQYMKINESTIEYFYVDIIRSASSDTSLLDTLVSCVTLSQDFIERHFEDFSRYEIVSLYDQDYISEKFIYRHLDEINPKALLMSQARTREKLIKLIEYNLIDIKFIRKQGDTI